MKWEQQPPDVWEWKRQHKHESDDDTEPPAAPPEPLSKSELREMISKRRKIEGEQ